VSFSSLEELLFTYAAAREGRPSRISRDSRQADRFALNAELVDFVALDTLHILTNIPEGFILDGFDVSEENISAMYVTSQFATGDEIHESLGWRSMFFSVTRWTYEDLEEWGMSCPLDGVVRKNCPYGGIFPIRGGFTEENLIMGRYHIDRSSTTWYSIYWAEGPNRFTLSIPREVFDNSGGRSSGGVTFGRATETNVYDIINFAQYVCKRHNCRT